MVGNKAQKAVAAALTGVLAFGGIAPAFAGVWTGDEGASWYRINGDHSVTYQLGTLNDDDELSTSGTITSVALSGTEAVKGQNRYDTAWDAINYNKQWFEGTKYLVLASGESQADTLVASGVAGMLSEKLFNDANWMKTSGGIYDVPVMITPANELCVQAKRAIEWAAKNSKAGKAEDFKVYIIGGEAAVSKAVEDAVADIEVTLADKKKDNISVERVWGENRIATSLEAAKVVDVDTWLDDDKAVDNNRVYVANGKAWPDALSVSSYAYTNGQPILLTDVDGKLSDEQLDYLKKFDDTVTINVIGGPAQPGAQQLWDAGFKAARVTYVAGINRYETSAKVIKDHGAWYTTTVAVANGTEGHWADALIGGPFVGVTGGVLALVDGVDEVTALKAAYAEKKDSEPWVGKKDSAETGEWSFIIGGKAAIDDKFADKLNDNFPEKV